MKRTFTLLLTGVLIVTLVTACRNGDQKPLRIAISKASPNYVNWLKRADSTIVTVNMYAMPVDSALMALETCSGLLLSGGEDVYPGIYGAEYDTARCTEIDRHRDSLEIALIARASDLGLPIMGICRGNQVLNVYFGGTLVVDIPQDIGMKTIHQCDDWEHCFHEAYPVKGTVLMEISNTDSAAVTTNHHQAVKILAKGLRANVYSADSLIEGIEWAEAEGKPFLLGVQWHPERMDKENPLSGPLALRFVGECRNK